MGELREGESTDGEGGSAATGDSDRPVAETIGGRDNLGSMWL